MIFSIIFVPNCIFWEPNGIASMRRFHLVPTILDLMQLGKLMQFPFIDICVILFGDAVISFGALTSAHSLIYNIRLFDCLLNRRNSIYNLFYSFLWD